MCVCACMCWGQCNMGTVVYAPEKDVIVWNIKQFPGGREFLMRAHFGLPSIHAGEENPNTRPPIVVKFEIPYFTVSGIQVRYLKIIERSGYQVHFLHYAVLLYRSLTVSRCPCALCVRWEQALPWVRYITQSGDYQIRV
jgi:AP-1 complex subunit mu